jgi:hypothetical protein
MLCMQPDDGIYGTKRVTRHPTFWSMASVGLGAALASPFATEIVMFSMPALFAVIGTAHQVFFTFLSHSPQHLCTAMTAAACMLCPGDTHVQYVGSTNVKCWFVTLV